MSSLDFPFWKKARKFLVFILGLVLSSYLIAYVDVEIRNTWIDPNDSSTWPNMAPGILYSLLGFLLIPTIVIALGFELIGSKLLKRQFPNSYWWFFTGCLYSLCFLGFVLRHTSVGYVEFRYFGFGIAVLTSIVLKIAYGVSKIESTV